MVVVWKMCQKGKNKIWGKEITTVAQMKCQDDLNSWSHKEAMIYLRQKSRIAQIQ